MDFKNEIKDRIEMRDICLKYGIEVNEAGFAKCPFHNEKTSSMKIYPGRRGFYCFGCGKGGDVISFAGDLFNLNFISAISKINEDFGLTLPIGERLTTEDRHRINAQRAENERKKKIEETNRQKEKEYLNALTDEYRRLYINKEKYQPKNMNGKIVPLYLEAVEKLDLLEYKIEQSERRLRKWKTLA